MPSTQISGYMKGIVGEGKLSGIDSLEITIPSKSIKSGKRAMDNKAHKTLKTNKHKQVIFELKSASPSRNGWILNGIFQIAGVSKNVSITASETSSEEVYGLKGSYEISLSDFDITPPTALMGTVKAGDKVKISFDIEFE